MKTYYKLVSKDLQSAIMSNNRDYRIKDLSVQYKVGEWVSPHIEGSQLMVFDSLRNLRLFVNNPDRYRIFKCEVKGISEHRIFKKLFRLKMNLTTLKTVWKARKNKKKFVGLMQSDIPPAGTIFCSQVKLIEEIK